MKTRCKVKKIMKTNILICLTILITCSISAQTESTINWGNGTPKIRLLLRGAETLRFEEYRENGSILERRWAEDSVYIYDRRGIVIQKQFFNTPLKYKKIDIGVDREPDSLIKNYPNGTILSKKYMDINGIKHSYSYSVKGEIEEHVIEVKINDKTTKSSTYNHLNKCIETCLVFHDSKIKKGTKYYETGEISAVYEIAVDSFFFTSYKSFDKNGQIPIEDPFNIRDYLKATVHDSILEKNPSNGGFRYLLPEEYPDTLSVKEQDSYVGLVDLKGNWVLPAKFNKIETYQNNHFKVMVNGLFGIVARNGEWLIPPQYSNIKFTHLPDIFIVEKTDKVKDNPNWTSFSTISHYGLVKIDGTEILPAKFHEIRAINWRSPVFIIQSRYSCKKGEDDFSSGNFGLFDAYKGFIVDTSYQEYKDENSFESFDFNTFDYKKQFYVILKNSKTNKAEVFDHFGQPIFNSGFEKIQFQKDALAATHFRCGMSVYEYTDRNFYPDFGYLIVNNAGKAGLYDLDKQNWKIKMNRYDTILTWLYKHEDRDFPFFSLIDNSDVDGELVLLAKEKGQWWILNTDGLLVYQTSFDNVGEIPLNCSNTVGELRCYDKSIFGIKDGKIYIFSESSYPNPSTVQESVLFQKDEESQVISTFSGKKFSINKEGIITEK
jgi:hypothetical protein